MLAYLFFVLQILQNIIFIPLRYINFYYFAYFYLFYLFYYMNVLLLLIYIYIQGEPSESITSNNSFGWPGIKKSFILKLYGFKRGV